MLSGAVQATGGIRISTSQDDGGVGLFTSSQSVLRTDATGGGALPATGAPSYLEIHTANGVEIDGLVEAADEGTVVNISAGGLLVLDGVVKADGAVNLTGGSNASGVGIVLTQLVVQTDAYGNPLNEEGQPIDRDGFLIGLIDGEWVWVDETGSPLPAGGAPVYGGEPVRLSGGTLITGADGIIGLSAEQDILLLGMVGQVYKLNDLPAVDVAVVNVVSTSGDVLVYELINSRDAINIEARNIEILGDALVKTRHQGSAVYFRAQEEIFVEQSPWSTDRARVQAAELVHFYAGSIQVDGSLFAQDTGARVILNAVDDLTIYGEVVSLGDIELNAGVAAGLQRSESEGGGFGLSDLDAGSIYLGGEALLDALGGIVLRAADDLKLVAAAQVGGQTSQAEPHIVQHAQTVQVVTGTRQVEDGYITVPETHWITTTVTEQVGGELIVTGTRYYTMDVMLLQIGYWNPNASYSAPPRVLRGGRRLSERRHRLERSGHSPVGRDLRAAQRRPAVAGPEPLGIQASLRFHLEERLGARLHRWHLAVGCSLGQQPAEGRFARSGRLGRQVHPHPRWRGGVPGKRHPAHGPRRRERVGNNRGPMARYR
jgi:hypothetical protein